MDSMKTKAFAAFLHKLRVDRRIILMDFCRTHGIEYGVASKMERGLLVPDGGTIEHHARCLGLSENAKEWGNLFQLAEQARQEITTSDQTEGRIAAQLPAVLRTRTGKKITDEQFDNLVELIRRS